MGVDTKSKECSGLVIALKGCSLLVKSLLHTRLVTVLLQFKCLKALFRVVVSNSDKKKKYCHICYNYVLTSANLIFDLRTCHTWCLKIFSHFKTFSQLNPKWIFVVIFIYCQKYPFLIFCCGFDSYVVSKSPHLSCLSRLRPNYVPVQTKVSMLLIWVTISRTLLLGHIPMKTETQQTLNSCRVVCWSWG